MSEWGGWGEQQIEEGWRRGNNGMAVAVAMRRLCEETKATAAATAYWSGDESLCFHWTTVASERETAQPLWELLSVCVRDREMNVCTTTDHAGDLLMLVRFWPARTRRGFLQSSSCYTTTRASTAGKYSLLYSQSHCFPTVFLSREYVTFIFIHSCFHPFFFASFLPVSSLDSLHTIIFKFISICCFFFYSVQRLS